MTFVAGTVLTAAALNSELASKTDLAMIQNAQTGTTYSFALADASKLLTTSNASPVSVTVTKQATVTWVTGTQLRVMNLGAGVTTLVADMGVTINGNVALKQYQGGTLIRTSSDVWLFVPTSSSGGMDLITPTSVAGTGVTLSGGQINFSAATTISANGCFTATYDTYLVQTQLSAASTALQVNLRLRASGTDNAASNYYYNGMVNASSADTAFNAMRSNGLTTQWQLMNTITDDGFSRCYLSGPAQTFLTSWLNQTTGVNATDMFHGVNGGRLSVTTSYDGMSLVASTGNITGTLRIYGLRNS
jgi:hypothetical protein